MIKKSLFWLACITLSLGLFLSLASAQSSEELLNSLIGTNAGSNSASRWFNLGDKDRIISKGLSGMTLNLEAPVAKKDGKNITDYYITRWPISYKDITTTASADDLAKIRSSSEYTNNNKPVYTIVGDKLLLELPLADTNVDVYVTIAPQDEFQSQGNMIEDYKINPSTSSTTQVKADNFSNTTSNKAIADVSCIWTKDQNRVNLTWSVNTAMSQATKVEISHRGDTNQWPMDVKGTPTIGDKTFTMDTPHRNIQLFRLKPIDNNGTMIGEEIQYICKPDTTTTPVTPTDPTKPIPVTPHTGPKETFAFIAFVSALVYVIYRKTRKA